MKQNLAAAEVIPGADERLVIALTRPHRTISAIRALHLDVLFDFTSWQRLTAFYTLTSGARYTIGFRTPTQHRSRGYDHTVLHRADVHELENFRALVRGSGLSQTVSARAPHGPAVILPADAAPSPFAPQDDIVVFHPWASGQNAHLREWSEQNWLALAQHLAAASTRFLITGGPADHARAQRLAATLTAAGLRAEILSKHRRLPHSHHRAAPGAAGRQREHRRDAPGRDRRSAAHLHQRPQRQRTLGPHRPARNRR